MQRSTRSPDPFSRSTAATCQMHGAMGFTYEYSLHQFTRRLWSWRDEFGPEAYWAAQLGRSLTEQAANDVWACVTGTSESG